MKVIDTINNSIKYILNLKFTQYLLFPVFMISLHWIAVKFYNTYCAPDGFFGYLMTYLTTANPMCVYTIHIIEKTSNIYLTTWSFFSISTISAIVYSYKSLFS